MHQNTQRLIQGFGREKSRSRRSVDAVSHRVALKKRSDRQGENYEIIPRHSERMASPCEGIVVSGDWLDGVRGHLAGNRKLARSFLIGHRRMGLLPILLLPLLCLGALCGPGPEVCRDLGCPPIYYYAKVSCFREWRRPLRHSRAGARPSPEPRTLNPGTKLLAIP